MATEQSSERFTMSEHPDIVEMRTKYAQRADGALVMTSGGLALLAGLYAAISPWVVGFNGQTTLAANNLIVGIAIAVLALGFATAYERMHGLAWVSVLMGVWLIISPWVVSGSNDTRSVLWSNIVVGAVVVVLGLFSSSLGLVRVARAINTESTRAHLR